MGDLTHSGRRELTAGGGKGHRGAGLENTALRGCVARRGGRGWSCGQEEINCGRWQGPPRRRVGDTRRSEDVSNDEVGVEDQLDSVRRISSGGEFDMPRLLSKPMIMVKDETARAAPRMGHQEMAGAI